VRYERLDTGNKFTGHSASFGAADDIICDDDARLHARDDIDAALCQ